MKYYVLEDKIYIPEPVSKYLTNCFKLKLPQKYYDITEKKIVFIDDDNKTSIVVPESQTHDIVDVLLASALDFYIALSVCTDPNIELYNLIKKTRVKIKNILNININEYPEFPLCTGDMNAT